MSVRSAVTLIPGLDSANGQSRTDGRVWEDRSARFMALLLVIGLFVDYYGGFGVKYLVFLIALLWIAGRRKAIALFREIRRDIFVLIVIPIVFIGLHVVDNVLFAEEGVDWTTYLSRSYSTISSLVFLFMYPLVRRAG